MNRVFYLSLLVLIGCGKAVKNPVEIVQSAFAKSNANIINGEGMTLETRFKTPAGYERKAFPENSFAGFLRNLPLKPAGTKVKYYDGSTKHMDVCEAVVDMEIGKRDLQQCADAVMRLRAEYFYSRKAFDKISFNLTNGFRTDYSEWMKGNRVAVNGNKTWWRKSAEPSNTYKDFRNYMDLIFTYAGSLSLSKSMHSKKVSDISIGDVFIVGGSPGHAVIVVDVAENKSGEKVFMIAQSYMPAQEIEILKNPGDEDLSPWYSAGFTGDLKTPQWSFTADQLKTW